MQKWTVLKIILEFLKSQFTVTSESTNNALPDDGVNAPKHVAAVLVLILMYILKPFLKQFTCAPVGE